MTITARFVDYENPPVIEVAAGIKFKRLERFGTAHFGLFWSRLIESYPRVEDAPPILDESDVSLSFGPSLARTWFIDISDNWLVQVQPNRFHLNWRKQRDDAKYPHFQTIFERFEEARSKFGEFLTVQSLGSLVPTTFELTYVNHIFFEAGTPYAHRLSENIRDMNWTDDPSRFLPSPHHIDWRARFRLPNQMGELHAKLIPAQRKPDQKALFVLDLTARGLPPEQPLERVHEWFALAHEWIVKGFSDMTTAEAQKKWGKRV